LYLLISRKSFVINYGIPVLKDAKISCLGIGKIVAAGAPVLRPESKGFPELFKIGGRF
jgi:hypothetical protein